mmetsp:Transcript_30263/g.100313  ORF Transcript_30263/g.100313 Transcript_30263/m.100313 type:complete len:213 (-) Transcript_30263:916-1554(-)
MCCGRGGDWCKTASPSAEGCWHVRTHEFKPSRRPLRCLEDMRLRLAEATSVLLHRLERVEHNVVAICALLGRCLHAEAGEVADHSEALGVVDVQLLHAPEHEVILAPSRPSQDIAAVILARRVGLDCFSRVDLERTVHRGVQPVAVHQEGGAGPRGQYSAQSLGKKYSIRVSLHDEVVPEIGACLDDQIPGPKKVRGVHARIRRLHCDVDVA